MFDSKGAFTRQFTPVEGGYVYYPSAKSGGKLVTVEEYEMLVANWHKVAGRGGTLKAVGLISVAVLLWTLVSQASVMPEWSDWIIVVACVVALSGWILWASLAPRRLVKDRPDIAPPRPADQARREARAGLKWPFVIFFLAASGAILLGCLMSPEQTVSWWAWTIGSALFFTAYLRLTLQKLYDRQR